jgi:hypothetical protein
MMVRLGRWWQLRAVVSNAGEVVGTHHRPMVALEDAEAVTAAGGDRHRGATQRHTTQRRTTKEGAADSRWWPGDGSRRSSMPARCSGWCWGAWTVTDGGCPWWWL